MIALSGVKRFFEGLFSVAKTPAPFVELKVLVLNYAPIFPSEGGKRLNQVCEWNDPHTLTDGCIADLAECSGNYVRYRVVEWQDIDAYPVQKDGFRYTNESYIACHEEREQWHKPDAVDYHAIFRDFDVPAQVEKGEIDEVWLWGFPYGGFWESTMAGDGAYFCNSKPVKGVRASRIFVTMGFNYQRGVGEMLECFGHRIESIMRHVYGSWEHKETHAWNRFTLYDQVAPDKSACGKMHYAPSSGEDYEWDNPRAVWSTCDDWLNYPNLTGQRRKVDRKEWGGGKIRAHHRWWMQHLPRAEGRTKRKLNNWWAYAFDFNRFPESWGSIWDKIAGR